MDLTTEQYEALIRDNGLCLHGINELKTQVQLIVRLLNGSPDEDITGIRPRLKKVEAELQILVEKERVRDQWARIGRWVLGFLGVGNIAGLIALWRLLSGVTP